MKRTAAGGSRFGSMALETAMWVPSLLLLLVGMVEVARLTYTFYTLHKTLYTLGRFLATQQGVNYCDSADATVAAAKAYVLRGSPDESADTIVAGLDPEMIQIRAERINTDTGDLEECECSSTGCDAGQGGLSPQYVVVSIPDGYGMRIAIPGLNLDPILLRPVVRLPFGGV